MNASARSVLLRLIRDHAERWGWYQIDRALGREGIGGVNVPKALTELVEEGLVRGTGDVQLATTTYSLTAKGRNALEGPSV